jgi:hypothetical protein
MWQLGAVAMARCAWCHGVLVDGDVHHTGMEVLMGKGTDSQGTDGSTVEPKLWGHLEWHVRV